MECAYNAGVSAILLRANAYDPKEFAEFPPDQTFNNASELISIEASILLFTSNLAPLTR